LFGRIDDRHADNMIGTVAVEARSTYRADGPAAFRRLARLGFSMAKPQWRLHPSERQSIIN
jgi:hypothetical protein